MRLNGTIQLLRSQYNPAIGDPTPKYTSVILKYVIRITKGHPNGHHIDLIYEGEYKGTLEDHDGNAIDLNGFTLDGIEETQNIKNGDFPCWSIDVKNKKIVLC